MVIVMGLFTMATLLIVADTVFVPAAAGAVYVAVHTPLVQVNAERVPAAAVPAALAPVNSLLAALVRVLP